MAEAQCCRKLDVPFQQRIRAAESDERPASGIKHRRIRACRQICPDITIADVHCAFGRTEAEFECLLDFLREAQLDRVGCFAYSPVDGAAANALPDHVPDEVREERRARLMQLQQQISAQRLQRKVGTVLRVLIDEVGPKVATGRTSADAPEIDGIVEIATGRRKLNIGQFVDARITSAAEHDLRGTLA